VQFTPDIPLWFFVAAFDAAARAARELFDGLGSDRSQGPSITIRSQLT